MLYIIYLDDCDVWDEYYYTADVQESERRIVCI